MSKKNGHKHHRLNRFKDRLPGRILSFLLLLAAVSFVFLLIYTDMIPMMYIGIILVILMILVVVDYLLLMKIRKKTRFIFGSLLFLLLISGLGIAGYAIYRTYSALNVITNVNVETTEVNVYVNKEDNSNNLADIKDYTFGILQTLDREKTDSALEQLKLELGDDINIIEYESLTDLADSLSDEGNAIIVNSAYLAVFDDLKGYEDFADSVKTISTKKIETVVQKKEIEFVTKPIESDSDIDEKKTNKKSNLAEYYTIFISGIDTRGGMTASSLSDVNIIATVNTKTHQVLLLSTPRDFYVPLSISNGIPDKLTHAGIYGVNVCEDTLSMLYDTEINYYFRLNFNGFINIIDQLGGINVYSDYTFDTKNGSRNGHVYHFDEGWNFINGEQALGFCRERYAFASGDRQRGKNQMAVISAVIKKLQSSDLLKNYIDILGATTGCFESNVPYDLISELVKNQLDENAKWDVFSYSVDGTGDTQKPYSMRQKAYVMVPDQKTVDKAKELLNKVKTSQVLTADDATLLSSIGGHS